MDVQNVLKMICVDCLSHTHTSPCPLPVARVRIRKMRKRKLNRLTETPRLQILDCFLELALHINPKIMFHIYNRSYIRIDI